jgi:AhpD family alkylhydroperoxidase
MRNEIGTVALMAVVLACASDARAQKAAPPPKPQDMTSKPASTSAEALDDINKTFGFVPAFIKQMPDAMISTFWYAMKNFQTNPNTSLDAKTKELIGLAVASQIPCEYCVYFHTAAAKKAGASDQDIKEAVGMAAMTRMGSTLLNGSQIDKAQFRKDVDRIMARDEKSKVQARKP